MSTNTTQKLVNALDRIESIRKHLQRGQFTEESFTNAVYGTEGDTLRAAILTEFHSAAENLNIRSTDPIRARRPEFWQAAREMYKMRSTVVHRYGVRDLDMSKVWRAIGRLLEELCPIIKDFLTEEQAMEDETKNEEGACLLIED